MTAPRLSTASFPGFDRGALTALLFRTKPALEAMAREQRLVISPRYTKATLVAVLLREFAQRADTATAPKRVVQQAWENAVVAMAALRNEDLRLVIETQTAAAQQTPQNAPEAWSRPALLYDFIAPSTHTAVTKSPSGGGGGGDAPNLGARSSSVGKSGSGQGANVKQRESLTTKGVCSGKEVREAHVKLVLKMRLLRAGDESKDGGVPVESRHAPKRALTARERDLIWASVGFFDDADGYGDSVALTRGRRHKKKEAEGAGWQPVYGANHLVSMTHEPGSDAIEVIVRGEPAWWMRDAPCDWAIRSYWVNNYGDTAADTWMEGDIALVEGDDASPELVYELAAVSVRYKGAKDWKTLYDVRWALPE